MCRDKCVNMCTGRAKAMSDKISDAIAEIKENTKGSSSSHYILYGHVITMKEIISYFKTTII